MTPSLYLSPGGGAVRTGQSGIVVMIPDPAPCHSERSEESKVHDYKTGRLVHRLHRDQ